MTYVSSAAEISPVWHQGQDGELRGELGTAAGQRTERLRWLTAAFDTDVRALETCCILISATIGGRPPWSSHEETGEPDYEISLPPTAFGPAWEQLMTAGAPFGHQAGGSQASEALRIEAGSPKQAPTSTKRSCRRKPIWKGRPSASRKGCYPGQEVVARMDTYGNVRRHLVGLILKGRTVPPKGSKLFSGDREVGWISSATQSSALKAPIAFGFPLRDFTAAGTTLTIEADGAR